MTELKEGTLSRLPSEIATPPLASGAAEHADFVACFERYRKALGERGANAMLTAVLDATAG